MPTKPALAPLKLNWLERFVLYCRANNLFSEEGRRATVKELLAQGEPGIQVLLAMIAVSHRVTRYTTFAFKWLWLYLFWDALGHGWVSGQIIYGIYALLWCGGAYTRESSSLLTFAKLLQQNQEVRYVPLLIKYGVTKRRTEPTIEQCLTLLLPMMKLADAPLLTPEHRQLLNKSLLHSYTRQMPATAFKLAILKAYEQVGDASALEAVETLLARNTDPTLHEAAETCAGYLRQNMERVQEVQTLLRASTLPEHRNELLRPSQEQAEPT